MAWLKIYEWERQTYPRFRQVQINRHEQKKYLKKLCRHFEVSEPALKRSQKRGVALGWGGGSYQPSHWNSGTIKIGKMTSMGTLCHEFAHHLDWKRNGVCGHGKTFKRELKRVYTWAKRWLPEEWSDWVI